MAASSKPRAPLAPVLRIHATTGRTLDELRPRRGETIARFHARACRRGRLAGLPTIVCETIGDEQRPILKAQWHRRIGARTHLVLISAPLGGGGATGGGSGSVVGIVGLVALAAIASPVAGALAPILGLGSTGASVISALVIGGGSLLLSHFLNPKRGANSTAQNYSVDLKGNQARSQQPIPRQYGLVKFFPDYADPPWSDFQGTNQVFHGLYSLGLGRFTVHEIGIGQTPIWTAAGGLRAGYAGLVDLQFMAPGENCTLFPVDVFASSEVAGQTLPDPYGVTYADGSVNIGPDGDTAGVQVLGPYVANPAGTTTTHIAIDLIAPSGMYVRNSKGNTKPVSVDVRFEVQPIDDQGHVLGPWVTVIETPIIRESIPAVRLTLAADVGAARYQVRLSRLNAMRQDGGVDTMEWVGLRSYLAGPNAVPYASRLAVQLKGDRLLSPASGSQLYVIATAHVPVWNGVTMVEQASQNPVWAALDVWRNADYGGGLPSEKVDLQTLIALAAGADERGDTFNYRFTAQTRVLDAIETCLAPMLTQPVILWDRFSMVRDEPRALPKLVLTDNEIRPGTLEITYTLKDAQTSDGVILEYLDQDTWQQAEVTSRAEGVELQWPSRQQLPGCTDRRQGTVAARYMAAVNEYRRITAAMEIEADARLVQRGSLVVVQSEFPMTWGQSSRVLSFSGDASNGTIQAEAPLDWSAGGFFYVRLRRRDGSPYGPVLCARGASDDRIVLNTQDLARVTQLQGSWTDAVARTKRQDPASIQFSPAQATGFRGLVTAISQGSAENTFKLELVNDAPEVYLVDGQAVEPLPSPTSLVLPAAPANQFAHVVARLYQEGTSIALTAQWDADPGSIRYQARLSYDQGASWPTNFGTDFPFFTITGLSPNDCRLALRGVNAAGLVGGWTNIDLVSPELNLNPASLGFQIGFNDILPSLYTNVQMDPITAMEDLVAVSMESLADAATQRTVLEQSVAQVHAKFEEFNYAQALVGQALAGKVLTITATIADNAAHFEQQIQVQATATKAVATSVETLTVTVDENQAEAVRQIQVVADKTSAVATTLDSVKTQVADNQASVVQQFQAQSDINHSTATSILTLTASSDEANAAIVSERQVRQDGDTANARAIDTLSTTVGGHSASLSTLQASVNGVLVQYGVVGTIDGQTGGFIFQGVRRNDGSVYFGVYIKGDLIVDGTVQARNLANGAISAFAAAAGNLQGGDGNYPTLSVTISLDQPAQVLVDLRARCFNQGSTGATNVTGVIFVDGAQVMATNIYQFAGGTNTIAASCQAIVSVGAGQHTISAQAQSVTSADLGGVRDGYIVVEAYKR